MNLSAKTVRWKILSFFFASPEKEQYVNELSRSLGVSAGSVSVICAELASSGPCFPKPRKEIQFSIPSQPECLAKKLKSAWFIEKLPSAFQEAMAEPRVPVCRALRLILFRRVSFRRATSTSWVITNVAEAVSMKPSL